MFYLTEFKLISGTTTAITIIPTAIPIITIIIVYS
ncbi:MAG: hypothetical protein ACI9QD_000966, partial [Thermoproteota archaeon]